MLNENYHGTLAEHTIGKQISVFSDSIVISYDANTPGAGFYILMDVVYICNDLLSMGFPVRGGITIGSLIHKENICFGPAMNRAYLLESKCAVYPRILVDPPVIENAIKAPGLANTSEMESKYIQSLVEQDNDGLFYVEHLGQVQEFGEYDYIPFLQGVGEKIATSLQLYKNDTHVMQKWMWLQEYYNKIKNKFCPT